MLPCIWRGFVFFCFCVWLECYGACEAANPLGGDPRQTTTTGGQQQPTVTLYDVEVRQHGVEYTATKTFATPESFTETHMLGDDINPRHGDNGARFIARRNTSPISFSFLRKNLSVLENSSRRFLSQLHTISPSLCYTFLASVCIFILWNLPINAIRLGVLQPHFICSHYNWHQARFTSLLLSAVSHAGLFHLVFNLLALVKFGPSVKRALTRNDISISRSKQNASSVIPWDALWPLMLGAALSGSVTFLILGNRGGGCMGLSGVTLALLGVYAKCYPDQTLGMLVAGIIPVHMQASQWVQLTLAWSAVGCIIAQVNPSGAGRVAHAAHLGGILFGLGYYELWTRRRKIDNFLRPLVKTSPKKHR